MKVYENGVFRDATAEELAAWEADKAAAESIIVQMSVEEVLKLLAPQLVSNVPDETAKHMVDYFPVWDGDSVSYAVGDRVCYNHTLYKCITAHTSQSSWNPSDAVSLWRNISEEAQEADGSIEHPYAWEQGMTSYEGKYYTEDGKLYICIRDSINPLYSTIAALVNNYFNEVI